MPENGPALSLAEMAALGKLLEEHRPKLLAMLRRRIDPTLAVRFDPEDVCNEVFFVAQRRWSTFNADAPYAWLYRLALDCLIEAWRREHRRCRDLQRDLPWPEASSLQLCLSLVAPGTSPTGAALRHEMQEQMRQTLKLLKDADRQVLWMRYYDDLSYGEMAVVLGVTENAATVRCLRALRRLKELWQQLNPDPGVDR
jgi:RNA polymerase sigma-70 factor (ECF subfamily)